MKFKIGKTLVGENSPSFIVAELSGNHNGEYNRIKQMIAKAKEAGANAVKLQTYKPDTITIKSNKSDFKIIKNTPWKKKDVRGWVIETFKKNYHIQGRKRIRVGFHRGVGPDIFVDSGKACEPSINIIVYAINMYLIVCFKF